MIPIDFNLAISLYLFIAILLVFISWLFYTYSDEQKASQEMSAMLQCPFCTYIFSPKDDAPIERCPHCHSYINVSQPLT